MIRLLLADDQELIRSALAALLALQEDFEVVASVGRGDEVVAAARAHQPDIALLDIEMPGIDGLAGLRERVAAAGGVVDAGPLQPRGWRLQVRLAPAGPAR